MPRLVLYLLEWSAELIFPAVKLNTTLLVLIIQIYLLVILLNLKMTEQSLLEQLAKLAFVHIQRVFQILVIVVQVRFG